MKSDREFDDILNECLEGLLQGRTVEDCLNRYPEQAAELEPLLRTAMATREASVVTPDAGYLTRARAQFQSAMREEFARGRRPIFTWLPRWAATLVMVLGLILAGGGTVAASNYSMPGNVLYPVKLVTEQVSLALTTSVLGKVELGASLADRRVTEIVYLAQRGDAGRMEAVVQRLEQNLDIVTALSPAADSGGALKAMAPSSALQENADASEAPPRFGAAEDIVVGEADDSELETLLKNYAATQQAVLAGALEGAPAAVESALLEAMAITEAAYEQALGAMD